jgi:hypothetical protein
MSTMPSSTVRGARPPWSSAPPPIGWPLAACNAMLLIPAVAGGVFEWPWAITVALLLPGLVLQGWLGYRAARTLGIGRRTFVMPLRTRMTLGGLSGLTGVLAIQIRPTYFGPLVALVIVMVVLDPVWRVAWKRAWVGPT